MLKKDFKQGYSIINNEIIRNKELSLKAKGLYTVLISLPDNWNFSINGLKQIMKENDTSISSGLKELEEFGLLKRDYHNDKRGYKKAVYKITDELFFYTNTKVEIPTNENPSKEIQSNNKVKKETNKEITNKENKNKQKTYFEDSKINQLFLDFLEERTLNKKKATPKAVDRLINKLKTYPPSDWEEIIDNSIMNGWTGLFPLKTNIIVNQKKEEEIMRKFNKRYSISKSEHYYVRLRDGKEFTIEEFKKEKERLLNESN